MRLYLGNYVPGVKLGRYKTVEISGFHSSGSPKKNVGGALTVALELDSLWSVVDLSGKNSKRCGTNGLL